MAFVAETIRVVAEKHGVSSNALTRKGQTRRPFRARAEAMWIIYNNTRYSYPQLGRIFGRDHTSVIRACKIHEAFLAQQEAV